MELILYLVLAFSIFGLAVILLLGLFSASTPILLAILVVGILLVQKSINTFNNSQDPVTEKEKIQKVEKTQIKTTNNQGDINSENKAMSYRGSNYTSNTQVNTKVVSNSPPKKVIQYRGAKIEV